MPRFAAEKARSPERTPYHSCCKPATPIEIPRRSRFIPSPIRSPVDQPASPDLLFEMSPTCSSFPAQATAYPLSMAHSKDADDQPFMYTVPIIRPPGTELATWPRRKTSRPNVTTPSRNLNTTMVGAHSRARQWETFPLKVVGTADVITHSADCNVPPGTHSTTKITGFYPLNADQPPTFDDLPKSMERLSPPPRRSSYSPSPWILPGRSDNYDEDLSYSLADPSAFEFQRHLLRRIENKDSSRFASLHSCL